MYLIPCQPADFTIAHGTGESQIHCDIEFHIIALVQCFPDHICRPYVTLLVVGLGLVCMGKRVPCDNLPFYCLLEGTSEYLMDTVYSTGCKILTLRPFVFLRHRLCLLQPDIELIHKLRADVLNCHITDCGIDVICNQGTVGLIC